MFVGPVPVLSGLLALASSALAVSFTPTDASHSGFQCSYPSLRGWKACNGPNSRDCWLRRGAGIPHLGKSLVDVHTNYEDYTPPGITREYWLTLDEMGDTFAPDGYVKTRGKLFNSSAPGPLIEACWGDELVIHVTNNLPDNGTTVHWHGVRQLHTNEMDGVNGVTQCPIAQGDTYTYKFRAEQYGHTWYHSHYGLQYGDGATGPLLIHGPSSANWDEALTPVIINDWVHPTTFSLMPEELTGVPHRPQTQSILFNGTGQYPCSPTDPSCVGGGKPFETVFKKGKRYLLRLINGSVNSFFTFSIDQHSLEVISTDFVPIQPYKADNDSIMIGIGQRYSVVVEALKDTNATDFWIRTNPAQNCSDFENLTTLVTQTGIVRYDASSTADPTTTADPGIDTTCRDEPYASLVPIVPWEVNPNPLNAGELNNDTFFAGLVTNPAGTLHWELTDVPMFLNFSDPTILNLHNTTWDPQYAVVDYNYQDDGFVYVIITATALNNTVTSDLKAAAPVAHPIHLHGHDFAVLAQSDQAYNPDTSKADWKFGNPPRRDVVLLRSGGYLALAFKPDNPGIWLMHCHIAWHSSSGLALQIIERQGDIQRSIGPLGPVEQVCKGWDDWNLFYIQDESGI